jgi:hypothetical protein
MNGNRLNDDDKKVVQGGTDTPAEAKKDKKKVKDEETSNTGFCSSRVRDANSRTQDSGDPSIP